MMIGIIAIILSGLIGVYLPKILDYAVGGKSRKYDKGIDLLKEEEYFEVAMVNLLVDLDLIIEINLDGFKMSKRKAHSLGIIGINDDVKTITGNKIRLQYLMKQSALLNEVYGK
ncbi:hypothetical protein KAR91_24235 [Candidatus Pacearchaeota archaeon]|nr:hypothetical protein [Candidatus Pacearchaeota archaeon]